MRSALRLSGTRTAGRTRTVTVRVRAPEHAVDDGGGATNSPAHGDGGYGAVFDAGAAFHAPFRMANRDAALRFRGFEYLMRTNFQTTTARNACPNIETKRFSVFGIGVVVHGEFLLANGGVYAHDTTPRMAKATAAAKEAMPKGSIVRSSRSTPERLVKVVDPVKSNANFPEIVALDTTDAAISHGVAPNAIEAMIP